MNTERVANAEKGMFHLEGGKKILFKVGLYILIQLRLLKLKDGEKK